MPPTRRLKLVFVTQHYPPDVASAGQLLSDICEDLAAAGHFVTVLTSLPYTVAESDSQQPPTVEKIRGVTVRRLPSYRHKETKFQRAVHYLSFAASSTAVALINKKPDLLFVISTPPLLGGFGGQLLHALRGVPYVYGVQDLFPDILVAFEALRKDSKLFRVLDRVERSIERSAAATVTIGERMAETILAKGAVSQESLSIIPNWTDANRVVPVGKDNPFARKYGLHERFVAGYSGNFGYSHGVEMLPDVAEALRVYNIETLLIGDGVLRTRLEKDLQAHGLATNILPFQPRAYVAQSLSSIDVHLLPQGQGLSRFQVPSKLYGIMAVGRPVVAAVDSDGEVASVIRKHQCGVVVTPGDAAAMAEAVVQLRDDPERASVMGRAGRKALEENYTREICTEKYRQLIEDIATRG